MKEGDVIYCIKDIEYRWDLDSKWDLELFTGENVLFFHPKNTILNCNIKGKEYSIYTIDDRIYVTTEENTTPYNIYGLSKKTFNKHFIYGKEYRKLKLEKLNEARNKKR